MRPNIYEIPKVPPFIKTLEKVKELWDNLDEHIEITSQLWEDSKSSDAYYDRYYPERHWRDHLLELLFDEDEIAKHTNFEYDAKINGTYILSHLDSDLCRLNRFNMYIGNQVVVFFCKFFNFILNSFFCNWS